jgi:hypothetical protein
MTRKFHAAIGVGALILACGTAHMTVAAEPELSRRDYNAIREYAYRYFLSYREKYGSALRIQQMLKACDLKELAAQVDRDLPKVSLYTGEQFAADQKSTPFDLSRSGMALAVALATQSLTEGYELGYLEAFKSEAKATSGCAAVSKVYDGYLKSKAK